MWFKNLEINRLSAPWAMTPDQLESVLAPLAFMDAGSLEMQTQGWASPRDNDKLVHTVKRQMLLRAFSNRRDTRIFFGRFDRVAACRSMLRTERQVPFKHGI